MQKRFPKNNLFHKSQACRNFQPSCSSCLSPHAKVHHGITRPILQLHPEMTWSNMRLVCKERPTDTAVHHPIVDLIAVDLLSTFTSTL